CDDELVGEGDGGGSPNAPDDECTIACDPGWGEPGGGGSSGINLPTNPANEDIFVVIDPNTGLMLDLTFLSEYLSWLTQDLISKILSNEWTNNIPTASALPNFDGDASILSTIWVFPVVEPTPVGEIIASIATGIILPVQIYRASSFFSSGVAMR